MIMIVLVADLGAILTDFGTKCTLLLAEFAVSSHQANTRLQHFDALHATVRAVVHAFLAGHFGETDFAVDQAYLAGFQAFHVRGFY